MSGPDDGLHRLIVWWDRTFGRTAGWAALVRLVGVCLVLTAVGTPALRSLEWSSASLVRLGPTVVLAGLAAISGIRMCTGHGGRRLGLAVLALLVARSIGVFVWTGNATSLLGGVGHGILLVMLWHPASRAVVDPRGDDPAPRADAPRLLRALLLALVPWSGWGLVRAVLEYVPI